MKKRIAAPLFVLVSLIFAPICLVYGDSLEIDTTAVVYEVIDGDTFNSFPVGRVRLADIDTPEHGEPGYSEAKDFLRLMIYGERVYLDVDDIDVTDKYNRLVCLVYVRHNSTHLMNVNLALLVEGLAVISDYSNEFDPYKWDLLLYCPTTSLPEAYDELSQVYLELQFDYYELNVTCHELLEEYVTLQSELDSLKASYDTLKSDYNSLKASYDVLTSHYSDLQTYYGSLRSNYDSLKSSYDALNDDYESLESDYNELRSRHEISTGELSSTRNLMYLSVITTIALIGATAYFAIKKRRIKS